MRLLVAAGVVLFAFFIFVATLGNSDGSLIINFALSLIVGYWAYRHFGNYGVKAKRTASNALSKARKVTAEVATLVEDDQSDFFAIAEAEADDGTYNKGLWSQALVKAAGDEKKTENNVYQIESCTIKTTQY